MLDQGGDYLGVLQGGVQAPGVLGVLLEQGGDYLGVLQGGVQAPGVLGDLGVLLDQGDLPGVSRTDLH